MIVTVRIKEVVGKFYLQLKFCIYYGVTQQQTKIKQITEKNMHVDLSKHFIKYSVFLNKTFIY